MRRGPADPELAATLPARLTFTLLKEKDGEDSGACSIMIQHKGVEIVKRLTRMEPWQPNAKKADKEKVEEDDEKDYVKVVSEAVKSTNKQQKSILSYFQKTSKVAKKC